MEVKYIVSIILGGIFVLLFLSGIFSYFYNKNKTRKQANKIKEMYNDPNLAGMEYDFASYDDRVERLISASNADGQLTIDDVMLEAPAAAPDEGLDEITGNYKPD